MKHFLLMSHGATPKLTKSSKAYETLREAVLSAKEMQVRLSTRINIYRICEDGTFSLIAWG